jgi:ABC-type nitrate/sulfonate/bicarbonate transport system ATPase subunit
LSDIVLDNICKVYPGSNTTEALKNINLSIKSGEFVCILGPSGCGKSTLLEIIAGLQSASEGRILLDDTPVTGTSRDIGVVFQDSSLFKWRTVMENIEFGLEVKGESKAVRRELAQKYIEMVKLTGFENRYPHQLSGGMRQRAGIARTLVNNPKILLMDEPFGAVDYLTRLELQNEIIDISQKEKKTIIFITHDISEAVFLGDRVVLLTPRPGRIQEIFNIPVNKPRDRNDAAILEIEGRIYKAINHADSGAEPEYYL